MYEMVVRIYIGVEICDSLTDLALVYLYEKDNRPDYYSFDTDIGEIANDGPSEVHFGLQTYFTEMVIDAWRWILDSISGQYWTDVLDRYSFEKRTI